MTARISIPKPGPFFERLILYVLVSALLARVIFELALGMEPKVLNQQRQWLFYGLLALDYGWQLLNWRSLRFSLRRAHPIILLLFLMILHGVIVGLLQDNSKSRILIDTANVVIVLFNVIAFADARSFRDFDFRRLEKATYVISALMVLTGLAAMMVNSKSAPDLGSSTSTAVSLVVLCVGLLTARDGKGHLCRLLAIALLLGFSMPTWNRTTLAFLALLLSLHVLRNVMGRPMRVAQILVLGLLGAVAAFHLVPEDSKLVQRITGLQEIDLSERTGSIGERQAELDAISKKIEKLGFTGILFGAGHGAVYDVKYTWNVKRDYSNAHYGWALFYLRWGGLGYLYLGLWAVFLVVSAARALSSDRPEHLIVSLLALFAIGYIGTYAYFLFFIAGIPFAIAPGNREVRRSRETVMGRAVAFS